MVIGFTDTHFGEGSDAEGIIRTRSVADGIPAASLRWLEALQRSPAGWVSLRVDRSRAECRVELEVEWLRPHEARARDTVTELGLAVGPGVRNGPRGVSSAS